MPKKLPFEKTFQDATVCIYGNRYCVKTFYELKIDDLGNRTNSVKYYQVQKNRKKIQNYILLRQALKRMMLEANQELNLLFDILNV